MDLGLREKVALVTGGTAGIGLATARLLIEEGAHVALCGRDEGRVRAVEEELGPACLGVTADVASASDLERLVAAAMDRFGRVDVLVNNAGGGARFHSLEVTDEQWEHDLAVKLLAHARLARLVVPSMVERGGGAIVNVANTHARHPGASSVPTSASRAAGLAFAKSLSRDVAAQNVRVNTVCIGLVKSEQHDRRWRAGEDGLSRDDYYAKIAAARGVPMGRAGETEEAARLIVFLASPAAGFVSGTAVAIDGAESHTF